MVPVVHNLKILSVSLCNFVGLFTANFVQCDYVGVLIVLQLQDTICIHICTWPNVGSVTRSFLDLDAHISGTPY